MSVNSLTDLRMSRICAAMPNGLSAVADGALADARNAGVISCIVTGHTNAALRQPNGYFAVIFKIWRICPVLIMISLSQ